MVVRAATYESVHILASTHPHTRTHISHLINSPNKPRCKQGPRAEREWRART